jgi:ankyrin repeat protein
MWPKPRKKWQELDPDEVARQINEEYYAEQRRLKREEKKRKLKGEPAPEQKPEEQEVMIFEPEERLPPGEISMAELEFQITAQKELNVKLFAEVITNRLYLVQEILDKGADVNYTNSCGCTPLINSIINRHFKIMKLLVKNGADVNAETDSGYTALIYATAGGMLSYVKFLVKHGADINHRNILGHSALYCARTMPDIYPAKQKIIALLNQHGATF